MKRMAMALVQDVGAPAPSSHRLPPLPRATASVVICAYTEQRWDDLRRAVASVHHQRRAAHETLVVIDHNAALLERARSGLTGVRVLPNIGPKGLSGARNTGVDAATGDVIAFLDDDAAASPTWLEHLLRGYRYSTVLGVGGAIAPRWEQHRPSWFPPEFDWVIGCSYRGLPTEPSPVRNFIGANMSFRREVFNVVGGFTNGLGRMGALPLGCEETELCLRASEAFPDHALMYEPDAAVMHRVPGERATWRYFLRRCLSEGRSKAVVANLAGTAPALASERNYTRRVLPRGVVKAVADSVSSPGRVRAAAAIAVGLVVTAYGFFTGPLSERHASESHTVDTRLVSSQHREEGEGVARARIWRANRGHLLAMAVSTGLWLWSVPRIDLAAMNDYGLLSVLPLTFWLALAILSTSLVLQLTRGGSRRLGAAHVVLLVVVLHGTPILSYGTLRYAWAWKHVGVVDFVLRHHSPYIGNGFSAYAGWPGFFTLNATLTGGSGLHSALSYASWGPLVFNLLNLLPIFVIFSTFTSDRRHIWTAMWIAVLANWVGQDYFSPQAGAFFLYLCVIACCLRWIPDPRRVRSLTPNSTRAGATMHVLPRTGVPRRGAVYAVIGVLIVAIVTMHQLTPYVLVAGLLGLALTRTRKTGWLALVTFLLSVGWAATAARTFVRQNPSMAFGSIGSLFSNLLAGADGLAPHPSHPLVMVIRIGRIAFFLMWVLAVLGFWRRRERWRDHLPLAVLAFTPLPLILANNYGGEMLLRVYLFSLVPLSFFAAAAFFPQRDAGRSSRTAPALLVVVTVLLLGFTAAGYGKERYNYFTPQEVAASNWLFSQPAGTIYGATSNLPWAFKDYEKYQYHWFDYDEPAEQKAVLADPAAEIARDAAEQTPAGPAYVVLNRAQDAAVEMIGDLPADSVERIGRSLAASSQFVVSYRNDDVVIYQYIGGRTG